MFVFFSLFLPSPPPAPHVLPSSLASRCSLFTDKTAWRTALARPTLQNNLQNTAAELGVNQDMHKTHTGMDEIDEPNNRKPPTTTSGTIQRV
ncbi:uncharacterized protein SPSK_06790 [Sporothrix schenckii 1099-18]|uniref:Uncharacterized protein n=1 Tax=Sporothrix schenckii 1099-18 TaxID=1397361 RepID=A0A0F2MIE6_SPOSC|nr:uncharacterized protein SPSK_06790 [Sporothrix schenckii 1099-18]KJR89417.1 hypothetical protein SPSK_06790 [Sporothrix schenckii 1099-18]